MMNFLLEAGVLLKDFGSYVEQTTKQLREACYEAAERLQRPILYLQSSQDSKEKIAKKIAERDGVNKGLICLLKCVEPCRSYEIHRDRQRQRLILEPRQRKCLHIYRYWIDETFGFMSARVQTWFPFGLQVCVNGREWLARRLDRLAVSYQRRENCFLSLDDWQVAQKELDQQVLFDWPRALGSVACQINPGLPKILGDYPAEYYWTVYQSEWATDVLFRSRVSLAQIYPRLVRAGISTFGSPDVMRFLGKKLHGNFSGEVVSDYQQRPEGIRVKHWMGANSVKMYDKFGRSLRVETTVNDPQPFKVFRPIEGNPGGPRSWRPMRRGIADIAHRAQLSQASNRRYLEALASLDTSHPVQHLVDPLCVATVWNGRRERALRPWSKEDRLLLQTISRGEFVLNGFRNRDLLPALFPEALAAPQERHRAAARVTRKLRFLRAHGIIRKVAGSHRYLLTRKGREAATAILQYAVVTLDQLQKALFTGIRSNLAPPRPSCRAKLAPGLA
jgi:hypothetical protein